MPGVTESPRDLRKATRIFRVAFGGRLSAMGNQAVDRTTAIGETRNTPVRGGRKKLGFKVWLCSWQSLTVHCV